jgi:hypothetical protein
LLSSNFCEPQPQPPSAQRRPANSRWNAPRFPSKQPVVLSPQRIACRLEEHRGRRPAARRHPPGGS